MIGINNTLIKDVKTYLRLAKQARTKQEKDYYVTSAKLLLHRAGYDVSCVPEDPHLAIDVLERFTSATPSDVVEISERVSVPYEELFAQIEGL